MVICGGLEVGTWTVKGMETVNSLLNWRHSQQDFFTISKLKNGWVGLALIWAGSHLRIESSWKNSPLSLTSGKVLLFFQLLMLGFVWRMQMNPLLCLLKSMSMKFLAQNRRFWGCCRIQMKIYLNSFVNSSSVQMPGTMTCNRLLSRNGIPMFFNAKAVLSCRRRWSC